MRDFGRVAVLMGGVAAEREVSLRSGQAVLNGLLAAGVDAKAYDVTCITQLVDIAQHHDHAFIALHGRWGEDGQVQAILQSLRLPFTGSGMAASALAMDKLRTKLLWSGAGLATPRFVYSSTSHPIDLTALDMRFPLMVKPSHEGSSIGMRKVDNPEDLLDAIREAQRFDTEVLIEEFIQGREFTVALLNGRTLPMIELKTSHDFYDFDAKYQANDTQYICPCALDEASQDAINQLVLAGFAVLGAQGWGRMDVMLDQQNQPWLIELNTVPGMTEKSLVPKAAKQAGLSFEQLVVEILSGAQRA
jgi:D-alanine-D-alanine ligase